MVPPKEKTKRFLLDAGFRSRVLLVLLVVVMVLITIYVSGPIPNYEESMATATAQPIKMDPNTLMQITAKVPDILETTPTTGVVIGAAVVTIIIIAGTLIAIRGKDKKA